MTTPRSVQSKEGGAESEQMMSRARLQRRIGAIVLALLFGIVIGFSINSWVSEQTYWGIKLAPQGPQPCQQSEQCAFAWQVAAAPSLVADNYVILPGVRICAVNDLPITPATSAALINSSSRITLIEQGTCSNHIVNGPESVLPALIDFGVALVSALIAVLVYLHATQRRLVWHMSGFLASLVLAFGLLPAANENVVASVAEVTAASYLAVPLLTTLLWRLLFTTPRANQGMRRVGRSTAFILVMGSGIILASLLILAVAAQSQSLFDFERRFSLLYPALSMLLVLGTVFISTMMARGARREYARILGAATLIAVAPLLILTILPSIFTTSSIVDGTITSLTVIALPLALSYIILRRELLGVDSLVRRTTEQGLRVLALAMVATLLISGAALVFDVPRSDATSMFLPALLIGLLVPLIYGGVRWIAESALFPEVRRYRMILSRAANQAGIVEPPQIATELIGEVKLALPVRRAALYVCNDTTGDFIEAPEVERAGHDPRMFMANHLLLTIMRRSPSIITHRELGLAKAQVRERIALPSDTTPGGDPAAGWDIFVPVVLRDRVVAMLALGPRDDGFDFSGTDRSLLLALANRRALALDYARILADLRSAYEQQKEVDQLKDQFIMTAHHELRTPLAGMVGYIELLHDLGPEGRAAHQPQVEHFIDAARRAGEELSEMVSTLLQANEMLGQGGEIQPQHLDLSALVRSVAANVDVAFNASKPRITVQAPALCQVKTDQQSVSRIISNLLTNALKYSPEATPVEVSLRWEPAINLAEVAVRDYGVGIPASEQPKIFERFVRLESALNSPVRGSGLGLYVVRSLAEKIGGSIWVESSGMPGEGSTFHLTLPIEQATQDASVPVETLTPTVRRLR